MGWSLRSRQTRAARANESWTIVVCDAQQRCTVMPIDCVPSTSLEHASLQLPRTCLNHLALSVLLICPYCTSPRWLITTGGTSLVVSQTTGIEAIRCVCCTSIAIHDTRLHTWLNPTTHAVELPYDHVPCCLSANLTEEPHASSQH